MLQIQHRSRPAPANAPTPPAPAPGSPVAETSVRSSSGAEAKPRLGVSWLNNFLQVAVVEQDRVVAEWSSPLSGEDVRDLGDLLREAVKRTGYAGNTAALVLAQPQFIQQLVEAPPAKGAALDAYLQRQVDQQKGPEGALSWAAQPRLHSKTGQGFLLSMLPESWLEQVKREFQRAGLRLRVLVPVSAILQDLLVRLPRNPTETVMTVADTDGLTSLLVAQPNGSLILGRSVAGGWSAQADRVAMDIKRTSLFVSQQLGQVVGSIWLLAPPGVEVMRRLQSDLGIPVLPFPQEVTPTFWAAAVTRWPADKAPNLIPYEPEAAPGQGVVNRLFAVVTAGVCVLALGTVILLETLIRQETVTLGRLRTDAAQLQVRHLELQRLTGDVVSRRLAIRELQDNRLAPVPAWFLGQLGEACPRTLLLTSAQIRREGDVWRFAVGGRLQADARTNRTDGAALAAATKDFSARLTTSPLWARMSAAPAAATPAKPEPGSGPFARWAQTKGLNPAAPFADQRFVLEGTLQ